MASSPWMKTLTLGGTKQNLLTLMQAIDPGCPQRVSKLQLNWDPRNSSTTIAIGNDDLASTNYGQILSSISTIFNIENGDEDIINLSQIFLLSSAASVYVNVIAVPK